MTDSYAAMKAILNPDPSPQMQALFAPTNGITFKEKMFPYVLGALDVSAPLTIDFLQVATDGANLTTYTFSAQNLGATDADRTIAVCAFGRAGGTAGIASVTVAGVSCAELASGEGGGNTAAIFAASVPTGSTGDVVVTFDNAQARAGIALYRLVGAGSPADTDFGYSASNPISGSLSAPRGAIAVVGGHSGAGPLTTNWTGDLVEDFEQQIETIAMYSGATATTGGSLSFTADINLSGGATASSVLAAVAW